MTWQLILLYATPGLPLALTILVLAPALRPLLFRLLPFAPLPALAAALLLPDGLADPFPRTLLGAGLALDGTGRVFLGVAALLWTFAGLYVQSSISGERSARFAGFWLATLTGNMLLFVAADVVSFYLAFAILSLSAFGLVVHNGTPEARRAGRVYLILAILGETFLLLGFLIAGDWAGTIMIDDVRESLSQSAHRDLAITLLVAGFGLKAGLMPLHVWLPLAHPAAPVPASAVLSGAIVKAGIFGLVRFLPLESDLPVWSAMLVVLGLATAYLAVLFGVVQRRPKTVLAYSTVGQMGLVIVVIGSGFGSPGIGLVVAALALYSAHHALAKGALFLSIGVIERSGGAALRVVLAATGLAALAVAGLPFTGGALAKLAIKGPMGEGSATLLVTLSAVGTTLLMFRFLQLAMRTAPAGDMRPPLALAAPFLLCVAAALVVPWLLFPQLTEFALGYAVNPANLWGTLWPVLTGAALMAGALRLRRLPALRFPEGDMVVPMERAARHLILSSRRLARSKPPGSAALAAWPRAGRLIESAELRLSQWPVAGMLLVCVILLIFAGGLLG